MNIGIDFGSTYTTVSTFDQTADMPRAVKLDTSLPDSIPSIVSVKPVPKRDPIWKFGFGARDEITAASKRLKVYKAFKMLLVEDDQKTLERFGYDKEHTPREVATFFLKSILKGVQTRSMSETEEFENIYICVPEIWVSQIRSRSGDTLSRALDGRQILHEILTQDIGLPIRKEGVHVVTEPEAASAFFAYNYLKDEKRPFNGHLLLIDYGGGTLDLTLTEIKTVGEGSVEITRRDNGGAGENHRDENGELFQIGNAGIAFQRAVLEHVLIDGEVWTAENQPGRDSIAFAAAEKELETILKDPFAQAEMAMIFASYGSFSELDAMLNDDPIPLTQNGQEMFISFEEEMLPLTYQQLLLAYKETAAEVVDREINRICDRTRDRYGFDPRDPNTCNADNFKIALVGGFSSCYLVQNQIAQIFNLAADLDYDNRVSSMFSDQRELAISLGASLLAENKVKLHKTARYSIGIVSTVGVGNGKNAEYIKTVRYGILCGQELVPDRPNFILADENKDDTPDNRKPYGGAVYENIKEFVIEDTTNRSHGYLMPIKDILRRKLSVVPAEGFWNIGFSVGASDVITMHFSPIADNRKPITIQLERYSELFELANPKEIEEIDGKWIIK